MRARLKHEVAQRFLRLAAALVLLVAVSVMMGWIFEIPVLLSIHVRLHPIQFNTALCFVVVACLLGTLDSPKRKLTSMLLIMLVFIPSLIIVQSLFHVDLGIDQLFIESFLPSQLPGRMSTLTAVCFLLFALARFLLDHPSRSAPILLILMVTSVSLLTLSTLAIYGYVVDERASYDFGGSVPMSPISALLFLISIASLISVLVPRLLKAEFLAYLPYFVSICLVIVTGIGWKVAMIHEVYAIKSKAALQSELYANFIDGTLQEMARSLSRMAKRWAVQKGTPEDQ